MSRSGLDLKSLDGSRPGSRLPDSPAPPCSQQDNKIKQEPKTPIAPKKTQVCMSVRWEDNVHSCLPTLTITLLLPACLFSRLHFLPLSPPLLPGCEVKEHGFLGQSGSEVPVHAGLLGALLQRQLRTVQTSRQGERGERETVESTGWTGQERARKATVGGS